jgi:hypothetical protein
MRAIHNTREYYGGCEQKPLLGVQVQDHVINDLDPCRFLYQTGDDIDE